MACTEGTSWAEEVGIDATDVEAGGVEAIVAGIERVAAAVHALRVEGGESEMTHHPVQDNQ